MSHIAKESRLVVNIPKDFHDINKALRISEEIISVTRVSQKVPHLVNYGVWRGDLVSHI